MHVYSRIIGWNQSRMQSFSFTGAEIRSRSSVEVLKRATKQKDSHENFHQYVLLRKNICVGVVRFVSMSGHISNPRTMIKN